MHKFSNTVEEVSSRYGTKDAYVKIAVSVVKYRGPLAVEIPPDMSDIVIITDDGGRYDLMTVESVCLSGLFHASSVLFHRKLIPSKSGILVTVYSIEALYETSDDGTGIPCAISMAVVRHFLDGYTVSDGSDWYIKRSQQLGRRE